MSQHNVTRHESNIHLTRESTSAHLRHRQVASDGVYVGQHVFLIRGDDHDDGYPRFICTTVTPAAMYLYTQEAQTNTVHGG